MGLSKVVAAVVVLALLVSGSVRSQEPKRHDVLEMQFDNGGIVDLRLLCEGGKVIRGFALESDRNVPWLADTHKLTVSADGRLTGKLVLTPGPDLVAVVTARKGRTPPPPPKAEEFSLDIAAKDERISGTLTTARKENNGLLGHNIESVKVRGRTRPTSRQPVSPRLCIARMTRQQVISWRKP